MLFKKSVRCKADWQFTFIPYFYMVAPYMHLDMSASIILMYNGIIEYFT